MDRRSYTLSLKFAGREIDEVIIDQHYQVNHPEMSDWVILELVRLSALIEDLPKRKNGRYEYYALKPVYYKEKPHRVVIVLEKNCSYIGVVNAFRVKEKKWDSHQKKN